MQTLAKQAKSILLLYRKNEINDKLNTVNVVSVFVVFCANDIFQLNYFICIILFTFLVL